MQINEAQWLSQGGGSNGCLSTPIEGTNPLPFTCRSLPPPSSWVGTRPTLFYKILVTPSMKRIWDFHDSNECIRDEKFMWAEGRAKKFPRNIFVTHVYLQPPLWRQNCFCRCRKEDRFVFFLLLSSLQRITFIILLARLLFRWRLTIVEDFLLSANVIILLRPNERARQTGPNSMLKIRQNILWGSENFA